MYKIKEILKYISKLVQPLLDSVKTKKLEEKLPRDYTKERKYISSLIFDVLLEKTIVREALLKFPKDLDDPSSIAAYHALIHLEADEDLRKKDDLYKQEQDDYILYIAETFQKGEELPINIVKEYSDFYDWAPSQFSKTKKGVFEKLKRDINI